ncbi:hypothetical protein P775_15570 [Puniceibacterium antarcticum]|uniref:Lipoprotein n=1 Tax=Puniceibacterium antarcticum TaxID=1206336 RepID=A0A2G8RCA3_9RHOB|nr:hypothetical protein [Puniceibacterium antarcticum]PIL19205.1 hypothetical protein P775_15570 [Puniceibacterium antarcticum]
MKTTYIAGVCALGLGACAQVPTPLPDVTAEQAVANSAVASPISYADPLAGYSYRAPTGPRNWRQVNDEQAEGN